jgi:hypothetical protein
LIRAAMPLDTVSAFPKHFTHVAAHLSSRRLSSFSEVVARAAALTILFAAMVIAATDATVASGGSLHLSTDGTPALPTTGDCSRVNWTATDTDGRPFVPVDLDNDGFISCGSDMELGA